MNLSHPAVTIVILTYNAEKIIERCLRSLLSLSYPQVSWLVIDNNSQDATTEIVQTQFPQVQLLQTHENAGYTGGNNRGIELALQASADYVLVVNPDTFLQAPDFLTKMVEYLEQHPEVGIAGPRVFLRTVDRLQNTILFPPGLWRNAMHWVRYRWDRQFAQLSGDSVLPAQMLNGVCVLFRAACLREVGLFDESIFMYIEDADLAYRARLAGWQIHYLPVDSVIHEQQEQGYHETSFVAWLLKRNSVYYLHKINKRIDAWGYALFSLLLFCGKFIGGLWRGRHQEYIAFIHKLIVSYVVVLTGKAAGRPFLR